MEARWKEVARSGPTRRSTACADRRSRSRSHTRHTVGAGAAVRVAVTPLLPSCPHRHPPAVGRRPDIASTQISKNHPAPWANFPGSGGRMAKTVTVQSEGSQPKARDRTGIIVPDRNHGMQGLPVLGIFVRSSRRDGAGTRVQRRQGVEPGAPTARSVETAVTRVSKQQRRGRAGGFDDDVRRDAQICRGGQAVSWTAAG